MAEKMEKVWNITDHPNTDVKEQTLVIFGKTVMPGSYVKVPASALKNAHKLKKDVAGKLAHVGKEPPADYVAAKAPMQLSLPDTHSRARFAQSTNEAPPEPPPEPSKEPSEKPETDELLAAKSESIEEAAKDVESPPPPPPEPEVKVEEAIEAAPAEEPKGKSFGRSRR